MEKRERRGAELRMKGEERERVEMELGREEVDLVAELHTAASGKAGGQDLGGMRSRRREARVGEHHGARVWVSGRRVIHCRTFFLLCF